MPSFEVNFDGLVGPTHNYAGLSPGNVASIAHGGQASRPKEAALQGLGKMKRLANMGLVQGVLPPHERPHVSSLRSLGFGGSDAEILAEVAGQAPHLLAAVTSGSAMWTANAATVTPSIDAGDGRCHLTPANLVANFHRSIEAGQTAVTLRAIFGEGSLFVVHDPLPGSDATSDEGAANHTRLCASQDGAGVHLFVYGRVGLDRGGGGPTRYPARHTREASESIARTHLLDPSQTIFARQNPEVIDAGVFHNDVIAVGNQHVLLVHEQAWVDQRGVLNEIESKLGAELCVMAVPSERVSLSDAVATYLFNSQLVTKPDGSGEMILIAPTACAAHSGVRGMIEDLIADSGNPLVGVEHVDLDQSLSNGGGPACLRLRVVLTESERAALGGRVLLDDALHGDLVGWVEKHFRDELSPSDIADPLLLEESRGALDDLTGILGLGSIYPFQQA